MDSKAADSSESAPNHMVVDKDPGDNSQVHGQGNINVDKQNKTDVSNGDSARTQQGEIDFNNKYKTSDKGPYYVFVEHKDKSVGKLFPVRVGYYLRLNNEYKKSILDIKTVGRNRVKVILNDFRSANDLINNELLTKNNLIAYVPKFFTQKRGVIRMVDTFFSNEFLLNNIESSRKVVEIRRVEKKIIDSDGIEKFVKRQVVIVSFLGNEVPPFVRINGVNFPVEAYIQPVIQCHKCLRYGHVSKLCKNDDFHCKKCATIHKEGECDEQVRCIYCKNTDHPSISRQCPIYLKQKRIKERMAKQNLSFKEAEAIENNPSYSKIVTNNRFSILNTVENFPPLTSPASPIQVPVLKPRVSHQARPRLKPSQEVKSSKKRKAASPPTPTSPNTDAPSRLAIPNPYAEEFREYKEKLSERLLLFFNDLMSRIQGDNNLFTFNIKDSLNALLTDVENTSKDLDVSSDEFSEY